MAIVMNPIATGKVEKVEKVDGIWIKFPCVHLTTQEYIDRGESKCEPGHVGLVDRLDHRVCLKEINHRIHESEKGGDRGKEGVFPLGMLCEQRSDGEEHEEETWQILA